MKHYHLSAFPKRIPSKQAGPVISPKATAWFAALSSIFAGIAIAIVQNKAVSCIMALQESFSISAETAGWLSSVFCVMGIIMAFPGAQIVARLGLKRAGIISLLFALLGTLLGFVSDSVIALMLSRIIEGAGAGSIAIVIPTMISLWFAPEKRALPMSLWSTWQITAQSICFLFGTSLTNAFGWRGVWAAGGLTVALALVIYGLFAYPPREACPTRKPAASKKERFEQMKCLHDRNVRLVCLAMLLFAAGNFGFVTWIASAWSLRFQLPLSDANRSISLMYLLAIPISLAFGIILEHVDHKKICLVGLFSYAAVAAAAFLLPKAGLILPYILIYPFFESAVCTTLWTIISEAVPNQQNTAAVMAMFTAMQNIGMLLGPPLSGIAVDTGSAVITAISVALPCAVGGVCILLNGSRSARAARQ